MSGYRDYQFNSGSVMNLNSNLEQKQALNEMRILYEALTHKESLAIIKDFLVQDIQNRPAYYLGGFGTTMTIGKTLTNQIAKNTYKFSITGAKVTDSVHQLYETYNPNNSFIPVRRYDPLILDLNNNIYYINQ